MINIMNNKNGHNIVNNIMNDMLSVVQKIWFCFHFLNYYTESKITCIFTLNNEVTTMKDPHCIG